MVVRRLFFGNRLDDGSRILGVGITYEVGVAFDASGNIFICNAAGSSRDVYSFTTNFAAGINKTATVGSGSVEFRALAISGSSLFCAGQFATATPNYRQGVFATQTSFTSEDFERRCSYASDTTATNASFAACSDGGTGVYIAGVHDTQERDIIKFTSTGTESWDQDLTDTGAVIDSATVYDIGVNPSNSHVVMVGGAVRTSDGDTRGYAVAYNSSGTYQWYTDWYGTGTNIAKALCFDGSGNLYVALAGAGGALSCIIKVDTSGNLTASYKIDTAQVTDLLGIAYLNSGIIAVGKHASGGYAILRMDTSLANATATRLVDTAGASTYPRTVKINYSGGFYYFNFGTNGSNLALAKVSASILTAPYAVFGNRFTFSAFTPSTAAYTITETTGGAGLSTGAAATSSDGGQISGVSSISAASLTDYFIS